MIGYPDGRRERNVLLSACECSKEIVEFMGIEEIKKLELARI